MLLCFLKTGGAARSQRRGSLWHAPWSDGRRPQRQGLPVSAPSLHPEGPFGDNLDCVEEVWLCGQSPIERFILVPVSSFFTVKSDISSSLSIIYNRVERTELKSHTCELSEMGYNFFTELFHRCDKDDDGVLNDAELEDVFSTCIPPAWPTEWGKSFPLGIVQTNESGHVSLAGWLSIWRYVIRHTKAVLTNCSIRTQHDNAFTPPYDLALLGFPRF